MITVERFIQEAFKIQTKKPIYKPGGSGNGKIWENIHPNNVYEPGVYGCKEVK